MLLERLRALLRGVARGGIILLFQRILRSGELLTSNLLSTLTNLLKLLALRRVHARLVPTRARNIRSRLPHLIGDSLLPTGVLLCGRVGLSGTLASLLRHLARFLGGGLCGLLRGFSGLILFG